jgi:hypothetical protein
MSEAERAAVEANLAAAGLTPAAGELDLIVARYQQLAAAMQRLHTLPEARYEDPALVFDPDPDLAGW